VRFRLRAALRNLIRKSEVEKDLDAEMRAFVGLVADQEEAAGASRAEAERRALAACGGMERMKQEVRAGRSGVMLETLWQDLRFGARQLLRNRAFAMAAILLLGIGIGANTAIFSYVNSVLLRPLPYPDAGRLAMILSEFGNSSRSPASMFELYQMRRHLGDEPGVAGKRRPGAGQGWRGHIQLPPSLLRASRPRPLLWAGGRP